MKHFFRAIFFLSAPLAALPVAAQSPTFQWARQRSLSISFGAINMRPPYLCAADPQGGALLVGMEAWQRNWGSDSYGSLQWARYLADGTEAAAWGMPGNAVCRNAAFAPDGSIYAMGDFLDSLRLDADHLLTTPANEPHTFLAHLDNGGNVLWMSDLTVDHGVSQPAGLDLGPDSSLYVGVHAGYDGRVMHFTADGTLLGQIMQDVMLESLDVDAQGNVFVTGGCVPMAGGSFGGVTFALPAGIPGYNRYLARYAADGQPVFVNFVEDVSCLHTEVRSDGQGGAYWAGQLLDEATFGNTTLQGPSTGSTPDFHLVRVDAMGNYLWALEGPLANPEGAGTGRGQFLAVDNSSRAYIGGITRGDLDWGGGIATSSLGYNSAFVAGYSPDGNLLWVETGNGTASSWGQSLCASGDGTVHLAGLAYDSCQFGAHSTSDSARYYPFIAQLASGLSTGLAQMAERASAPDLFPVPAHDRLWITDAIGVRVDIMDVRGRLLGGSASYDGTGIDVSGLAPGMYLLKVTGEAKSWSRRFVRQ